MCISQCTHTLIDEIWSSLLENTTEHLIVIQFIGALLDGYRLFDLNIPREILIQQNQLKYEKTLEKLRKHVDETVGIHLQCNILLISLILVQYIEFQ